jgi:hypothetical protein
VILNPEIGRQVTIIILGLDVAAVRAASTAVFVWLTRFRRVSVRRSTTSLARR